MIVKEKIAGYTLYEKCIIGVARRKTPPFVYFSLGTVADTWYSGRDRENNEICVAKREKGVSLWTSSSSE
ncbi:MAG: hypothetical protein ACLFR8_03255 [Alkalispirochaeta sp.]